MYLWVHKRKLNLSEKHESNENLTTASTHKHMHEPLHINTMY